MKAEVLTIRTTSEGGLLPFFHQDTQDPAEMERRVKEWEASHGAYSHILFACEAGILHTPRPATGILVLRNQPVVVAPDIDQTQVQDVTREMAATSTPAADLPFFAWCLVPLVCVTKDPADLWRGVPARKVGVNKLHCKRG